MKDLPDKIQWHPGFAAATGLEFRDDYKYVKLESEYNLSKEPIRIDLLITKDKGLSRKFSNEIGHLMRTYNIIEYKSPGDSINIDDYYKTIGYACFYKGHGEHVDEIQAEKITVSLFCTGKPVKLLKRLEKSGLGIEWKYPGIYYITGNTLFPVQIVVINSLKKEHSSLRILSDKANKEDVENFLQNAVKSNEQWEREYIDAVLQVSVSANRELYEQIREETGMCQALRELMKDEFEDAEKKAEKRGERRGEKNGGIRKEAIIVKNMYNNGLTPEEISTMTNINLDRVKKIVYGEKAVTV